MDTQKTLELKITQLARAISLIGLVGLLLLSFITVAEVMLRWIFKYSIAGVFDLSQVLIVVVGASCLPFVCAERRHVTVRLLGAVSAKWVTAIVEAFGTLVTMLIFGLLSWQLWIYANELAKSKESTWLMHWPLTPWWRVTTIIMVLCAAIEFVLLFISIRYGFTQKEDADLKPK